MWNSAKPITQELLTMSICKMSLKCTYEIRSTSRRGQWVNQNTAAHTIDLFSAIEIAEGHSPVSAHSEDSKC